MRGWLVFGTVVCASYAGAQVPVGVQPAPHYVRDLAADSAARARDSAAGLQWTLPPRRDLSHYTVGMCVSGVNAMDMERRKRFVHDTVQRMRAADTLATEAWTFARACVTRWTVSSVPARDLDAFVRLAFAADEVQLARAAVDRRLREASNDSLRSSVLMDAIAAAGSATPLRLNLADTFARRASELNPSVGVWRVNAERLYMDLLETVPYDTVRILSAAGRGLEDLRTIHTLTGPQGVYISMNVPYAFHARQTADLYARLPIDTIAKHYREGGMAEYALTWQGAQPLPTWARDFRSDEQLTGFLDRQVEGTRDHVAELGTVVPPITGGYWFPTVRDTTPVPAIPPFTTGHVTLFIEVNRSEAGTDAMKSLVRLLHDRYMDHGLDIILVDHTRGYAWNSPPLTPDAEARMVAWDLHDVCNLPVPVIVNPTFAKPFAGNNKSDPFPILVGRDGRMYEYAMPPSMMEAIVRQALGLPEEHQ